MYKLLPILLKKIGYQESSKDDDLINCLRQEITKWACALGDPNCRKNAIIKLEWHLANPEKNKYVQNRSNIIFIVTFFSLMCCATFNNFSG